MRTNKDYKIKREKVEGGYYYDVYIKVDGVRGDAVWEVLDSFQSRENAKKCIENDIKKSTKEEN